MAEEDVKCEKVDRVDTKFDFRHYSDDFAEFMEKEISDSRFGHWMGSVLNQFFAVITGGAWISFYTLYYLYRFTVSADLDQYRKTVYYTNGEKHSLEDCNICGSRREENTKVMTPDGSDEKHDTVEEAKESENTLGKEDEESFAEKVSDDESGGEDDSSLGQDRSLLSGDEGEK